MALTGALTYKGLTISNAHLKVMTINHRAVDISTEAEDGTIYTYPVTSEWFNYKGYTYIAE